MQTGNGQYLGQVTVSIVRSFMFQQVLKANPATAGLREDTLPRKRPKLILGAREVWLAFWGITHMIQQTYEQ